MLLFHHQIPEYLPETLFPSHHHITQVPLTPHHDHITNQFITSKLFLHVKTFIHAPVKLLLFHRYKECKRVLCSILLNEDEEEFIVAPPLQLVTLTNQITKNDDNNDNPNK
jgi:hypothetical protein